MAMSTRVVLSGHTSLGSFLATINVYKDRQLKAMLCGVG